MESKVPMPFEEAWNKINDVYHVNQSLPEYTSKRRAFTVTIIDHNYQANLSIIIKKANDRRLYKGEKYEGDVAEFSLYEPANGRDDIDGFNRISVIFDEFPDFVKRFHHYLDHRRWRKVNLYDLYSSTDKELLSI